MRERREAAAMATRHTRSTEDLPANRTCSAGSGRFFPVMSRYPLPGLLLSARLFRAA